MEKTIKTEGKTSTESVGNKNTIRKIPKGHQRNKIRLTLDNSELDFFEKAVQSMPKELKAYIQDRITKCRKVGK